MRKENKKGVTLIALVVTVIVLLILASISTHSGIKIIENSKFNKFTAEMKTMQAQINSIYEKYRNGETITIGGNSYTGEQILEIESTVTSEVTAKNLMNYKKIQKQEYMKKKIINFGMKN